MILCTTHSLFSLWRHIACVYDGRGVASSEGGGALSGRAVCDGRNRGDTRLDRALMGLCGEVRANGGKCSREAGHWVMVVPAACCKCAENRMIWGRHEGEKALRTTSSFWMAGKLN